MSSVPSFSSNNYFTTSMGHTAGTIEALARSLCPDLISFNAHYMAQIDDWHCQFSFSDNTKYLTTSYSSLCSTLTMHNQQKGLPNGISGQAAQTFSGHSPQSQLGASAGSLQHYQQQQQQLAQYNQFAVYGCSTTASTYSAQSASAATSSYHGLAYPQPPEPEVKPTPLPCSAIRLGEFTGTRGWLLGSDGFLHSMSASVVWAPGEPMDGKTSSQAEHNGVYCYKKARDFLSNHSASTMVYGTVEIWGDIIEHELGYRAEWAKIKTLDGFTSNARTDKSRLKELRELYRLAA